MESCRNIMSKKNTDASWAAEDNTCDIEAKWYYNGVSADSGDSDNFWRRPLAGSQYLSEFSKCIENIDNLSNNEFENALIRLGLLSNSCLVMEKRSNFRSTIVDCGNQKTYNDTTAVKVKDTTEDKPIDFTLGNQHQDCTKSFGIRNDKVASESGLEKKAEVQKPTLRRGLISSSVATITQSGELVFSTPITAEVTEIEKCSCPTPIKLWNRIRRFFYRRNKQQKCNVHC